MDRQSLTVPDGADNYLDVTQADYDAVKPEDMSSYLSMDHILKEYKSLDCACCGAHFGYQHRRDPNIKLCNSRCLSVVDHKLRNQGGLFTKSPKLGFGNFPLSPSPEAPRIAMSGASIGASSITGVNIPIATSNATLETQAKKDYQGGIPTRQMNGGPGFKHGDDGSFGAVPSYGSNHRDRGGHVNGTLTLDRGRGGGFSNRGGGASRGGGRPGGFDRSGGQDNSRGGWQNPNQQRSTDETDAKLAPADIGKENQNGIPSVDSAFKPLIMDKREEVIRAAREGAKLTKPGIGGGLGNNLNDMAPVPKPLSILTKNSRPEREPEIPKQIPAPVKSVQTAAPTPAPEKQSRPSPVPVTVAKKPEAVAPTLAPAPTTVPAAAPSPPVKKTWKVDDLIPSLSLVNQAECVISFVWQPTKYTLTASADQQKIEVLQTDLAEYCANAPPMARVPAVGDIVFGPYEGDYYRGRVDKSDEAKKEVDLTFIDFGDKATVQISDCREPSDKIMRGNPIYGMIFNLNTKLPYPSGLRLTDEITKIVYDSVLYLQTDPTKKEAKLEWSGTLFIDNEGKKSLNSVLENHIIASSPTTVPAPSPAAQPSKPVEESKPKPAPASSAVQSSKPVKVEESKPKQSSPAPENSSPSPAPTTRPASSSSGTVTNPFRDRATSRPPVQTRKTLSNSPLTDSLIDGAIVRVNFVWNDAKVSISCTEDDGELDVLAELVAKHAEAAQEMSRIPDVGEIVIAPYNGFYYRGAVAAVNEDKVKVIFVDYGDETEVKYKELKELNADIAKRPIYGIIFNMDGVPKTDAVTENPELAAAMENGGQVEVLDQTNMREWSGRLWVSNDRTWNDIVLDIQKNLRAAAGN